MFFMMCNFLLDLNPSKNVLYWQNLHTKKELKDMYVGKNLTSSMFYFPNVQIMKQS